MEPKPPTSKAVVEVVDLSSDSDEEFFQEKFKPSAPTANKKPVIHMKVTPWNEQNCETDHFKFQVFTIKGVDHQFMTPVGS